MLGMEVLQPVNIISGTAYYQYHNVDPKGYIRHLWETLWEIYKKVANQMHSQL